MSKKIIELLKDEGLLYTAKYAEKYGVDSLASTFDLVPRYTQEELYRECLKQGKKWEDIIKKPSEETLL